MRYSRTQQSEEEGDYPDPNTNPTITLQLTPITFSMDTAWAGQMDGWQGLRRNVLWLGLPSMSVCSVNHDFTYILLIAIVQPTLLLLLLFLIGFFITTHDDGNKKKITICHFLLRLRLL